ncbi:DUF5363 domain-containing protein [Vibrio sp. J1-1]|uniref:DUF5363 family protein n=1 Tax=Vibrio sp. J1-1 TaxID=2912251 RepID=UPI001F39C48E|nr:DUF5363 family protein [Vibrio sp. J1-1]MBR9874139.1 hypothetical protein [Vibrionaceae bacterium]MCF7481328.1 DUF5363 domain-containing protein [Vibrio sp. J1-1]
MNWLKRGIKRYDDWCKEMGLTPDQKRSCVPYRKDPAHQSEEQNAALKSSESNRKSQDEAL